MRATGRGRAVSGKRPLSPGQASPSSSVASCDGAAVGAGESDSARSKRRRPHCAARPPHQHRPSSAAAEDDDCQLDDDDDDDDDYDLSSDEEVVAMLCLLGTASATINLSNAVLASMYHDQCHYNKRKMKRAPEGGYDWVMRTLNDPTECYNMFRMHKDLFYRLHDVLVQSYGLKSTTKCSSIEALGMFLWVLGAPQLARQAKNRFGRSLDTVHQNFAKVLKCVLKLAAKNIKPADPDFKTIPTRVQQPRFSPHFNNCIGAIDGIHIPVVVPTDKEAQYMCRKRYTSENILAVCDFDMRFTFVLAGWPGSVHDMRVFNDARTRYASHFPHPPPGMFYLVDFAYPNRPGYLAPYKKTKYHLRDWRSGPMPRDIKENFNYAHSCLRNVVERAFGVLKQKWQILEKVPSFPMAKPSRIIVACMALHNFIRDSAMEDQDFAKYDQDDEDVPKEAAVDKEMTVDEKTKDQSSVLKDVDMNAFRDQIANALFQRSR